MSDSSGRTGYLSPYRVLDLTDHRGIIAGRMLAQMGADVVQVEPPEGSDGRRIAPFDADGRSMHWEAYSAGKRGVELDFTRPEDVETLRRLVAQADFVIESRGPQERAPLSPEEIAQINPFAIHLLITPYGTTGPKAGWTGTDLTLWAAGGALLPTSVDGRAPMRIAVPQAWHHAAADAVDGALVAHFARLETGRGQRVETSVQRSGTQCTLSGSLAGAVGHKEFSLRPKFQGTKKPLDLSGSGARTQRSKWQGKDGLLEIHLAMGPATGRFTNAFFALMRERGALSNRFDDWDWSTLHHRIMTDELTDDDLEEARGEVGRFLAGITKVEAVELAIEYRLLLAPVATPADLAESPHEAARRFFNVVEDAEGRKTTLPGPYALPGTPGFAPDRAAPAIGQHQDEVMAEWLGEASARPAARAEAKARPLEGLKVLDLAWVVAGPMIGRQLADFGATVVRVESSVRIETARNIGPYPDGVFDPLRSTVFDNANTGKLGVTLDLAREEGRDVVRELARWADVVVESFAPGQMERWGIGYEALRALNPKLVMLSTSLMGQTGPWKRLAGFGNIGAAMAGYQGLVGPGDGLPIGPYGPYTDYVGPRYGLAALLGALDHRRRTGEGAHLDISQSEAGMQFLGSAIADYAATGRVARPDGNRDPQMAPHGVFRCRSSDDDPRWLAVAARTDAEWRAMAEALGLPDDGRFLTLEGRKAAEDALESVVAGALRELEVEDAERRLQAAGVPAALVASYEDLWADPHLRHQGHFQSLKRGEGGESWFETCRFALSETPAAPLMAAPGFGRDNDRVLRDILGWDDARIETLTEAGVLA